MECPSKGEPLVLASASAARAKLLAGAGVDFTVEPAMIDEVAIKRRFRDADADAEACALALAEAKAQAVSQRHKRALTIGADQLLVCDGRWYDKPVDRAAARRQLLALRGRTHLLASAVCVVRDGVLLWQAMSAARLTMRAFGAAFLDEYLATEGEAILGSVGAYRLEGRGVQLFERIDGDYFAILGLPLLELLGFLRRKGRLGR